MRTCKLVRSKNHLMCNVRQNINRQINNIFSDIDTAYKLELLSQVDASTVKGKYPSLYDVMNHCVTSLGKRTLRARILEPMCDISSINELHDCIEELGQDDYIELSSALSNILRNFNNVERLHKLALVVPRDDNLRVAEVLIKQTLHLKRCLKLVPVLRDKLVALQSKKLQEIGVNLTDERYQSLLDKIETIINPNLMDYQNDSGSQLHQRVNCIQGGVNELVDVLRGPYNELRIELEGEFYFYFLLQIFVHSFDMEFDVVNSYGCGNVHEIRSSI